MGFVRQAAKAGLFGLGGLAATGAFKKDKEKPVPSLITANQPSPSLVSKGY